MEEIWANMCNYVNMAKRLYSLAQCYIIKVRKGRYYDMSTLDKRIKEIMPKSGYTKETYKDSVIAMYKVEYERSNNNLSNYKHNKYLLLNEWARVMVAFEELPHIKNMNDLDEVLEVISDSNKFYEVLDFVYRESFKELGVEL